MQIQTQLVATDVLKKPEHILMFVKHVLEDAQMPGKSQTSTRRPKGTGLGLEDLRIIRDSNDEDGGGSWDSDDEDEGSGNTVPDEITVTTLNLLLALLEGNPSPPLLRSTILIRNYSELRIVCLHKPRAERYIPPA